MFVGRIACAAFVAWLALIGVGGVIATPQWITDECTKNNFPLAVCKMIVGAWKLASTTKNDAIRQFCVAYEDESDSDLCMELIQSGLFDEKGHETNCDAAANDLKGYCPTKKEEIEEYKKIMLEERATIGAPRPSALAKRLKKRLVKFSQEDKEMVPTTSFLQQAAKHKVVQCVVVAPGTNAVLDAAIGIPVQVIIDKPWSSAKLNRERPYMEPATRVYVSAANTGCVLNNDPAWHFCGTNALAPNNDHTATQCAVGGAGGATPALQHGNCPNAGIGANLGNFFTIGGGGGWLYNTFYGGNPAGLHGQADGPWLWMIDSCGNLKMGEEHQPRTPPVAMLNAGVNRGDRAIKHGDLNPTIIGDGREFGRTGGEFKIRTSTNLGAAPAWYINSCSSYFSLRKTNRFGFPTSLGRRELCNAVAHMNGFGLNTGVAKVITCKDWYRNHGQPDYARCLNCAAPLVNGKPPYMAC